MSLFSTTLNPNSSSQGTLIFGGGNNVLVITETTPASNPFASTDKVTLSYSSPNESYTFTIVSVASSSSTNLSVTFQVIPAPGPGAGGNSLQVSIITGAGTLQLQTPVSA